MAGRRSTWSGSSAWRRFAPVSRVPQTTSTTWTAPMVRLSAWSSDTIAPLTLEQVRLAEGSGLVAARVHEPPTLWRLVAGSRVGWVGGEDWEIRVVPALTIPKLMFLLGYAMDPTG